MIISKEDIENARDLIVDTEKKMHHTFKGMGKSKYADVMVAIQYRIAKAKKIRFAELLGHFSQDVDKREMLQILYTLEAMDKVKVSSEGTDIIIRYLGPDVDIL